MLKLTCYGCDDECRLEYEQSKIGPTGYSTWPNLCPLGFNGRCLWVGVCDSKPVGTDWKAAADYINKPVAFCRCCDTGYTQSGWNKLEGSQIQRDINGEPVLELRQCQCDNTLARKIEND